MSTVLHKACDDSPETLSIEKSVLLAHFVAIVSSSTAIATTAGARRQLAPTPAEGRCPTPTVGLVGASHCGTRPNVARPQATQRAPGAPNAGVHVDRERNRPPIPRALRAAPFHPTNASLVTAKWAFGDRRFVCAFGVVGASQASSCISQHLASALSVARAAHAVGSRARLDHVLPGNQSNGFTQVGQRPTQRGHTRMTCKYCLQLSA